MRLPMPYHLEEMGYAYFGLAKARASNSSTPATPCHRMGQLSPSKWCPFETYAELLLARGAAADCWPKDRQE